MELTLRQIADTAQAFLDSHECKCFGLTVDHHGHGTLHIGGFDLTAPGNWPSTAKVEDTGGSIHTSIEWCGITVLTVELKPEYYVSRGEAVPEGAAGT